MVPVEASEQIRRAYSCEQQSIRQIAREQGHGRDTVRAVIAGTTPEPRRYRLRHPKPHPVLDPVGAVIEA